MRWGHPPIATVLLQGIGSGWVDPGYSAIDDARVQNKYDSKGDHEELLNIVLGV